MKTTLFMVCCIATQMVFVDLKIHKHNLTSANNKFPAHSYGTGNQHAPHSVSIGSRPYYRHDHNPNGSSEYRSGQVHSKSRNTAYQRHGYLPKRGDTAMGKNFSNIFRTTKINSINRNIDDPESQRGKIFYSQEQNYPRDFDGSESLDANVPREYNNIQNQINFAHPSSMIQSKQEHTQSNNNGLFHHEPTPSINVDSRIIHVNPDEEQMYRYVYTDRALPEENMRLLDLDEQDEEVQDSQTNSLSSMDPSIMQFQEEQSQSNLKSEGSGVEDGAQDALESIEINSGTLIDGSILPSPHQTDSVDFEDDYQHPQYSVLKSKDYHLPQDRNHNQYLQEKEEIKFGMEKKSDPWENEGESNMKGGEVILLYPHRHSNKVQNDEGEDLYYIPRYLSANNTRSSIRNGDDTSKKDKNELDDHIKWKSSESGKKLKKSYDENKIVDNIAQDVLLKPMITRGDYGIATVNSSPLEGSEDSQMALLQYSANPYMYANARENLLPSRHRYTEQHHPHRQDFSHSNYLSNTNLQGDEATCKCCGTKLFYTYPELRPTEHDIHEVSHSIQNINLPGNAKYSDAHKTQILQPNPRCSRIAVAQQSHRNLYQWNTADDFLLQTQ